MFVFILFLILALPANAALQLVNPYVTKSNYYMVFYHIHTTNSDGNNSPMTIVSNWGTLGTNVYVTLTDHLLICPTNDLGEGATPISGFEWNDAAEGAKHIGGIFVSNVLTGTNAQGWINQIASQSGFSILNHPHYLGELSLADCLVNSNYNSIEVWNELLSENAEDYWDGLLSSNRTVWGICGLDAHGPASLTWTNPVNYVYADNPDPVSIRDSLISGNYTFTMKKSIRLRITVTNTTIYANIGGTACNYYWIIGGGITNKYTASAVSDSYTTTSDDSYVRLRVILGAYSAWSQPFYWSNRVTSSANTIRANTMRVFGP